MVSLSNTFVAIVEDIFRRTGKPSPCSLAHVKKIVSIKISREVQHR